MIGGLYSGDASLAGEALQGRGSTDAFLAALAADGAIRWVETFGGAAADSVVDVAFGPDQEAVVGAGRFEGTVDLGGEQITSAGGRDAVVILRQF